MKVLIIGAGAVASVLSNELAKDKAIEKITCTSRDTRRAKEFIKTGKKVSLKKLDASSSRNVEKAARGCDLVINASMPNFNEAIMRACLKVGANYQDLCSYLLDCKHAEQLKYHNEFRKKRLVALINTGVAPGVTNLLARQAADKLDNVTDINIRLVEEQKASELVFSWSPQVTLDELTAPPLGFKNSRFVFNKPFGDQEQYAFPQPFGRKRLVNLYGDEVATLPLYIKTRNIRFKSSGTDIDFAKSLYKLGLFERKPILVNGKKVSPVEFFSSIAPRVPTPKQMMKLVRNGTIENAEFMLSVQAIGKEKGRKISVTNNAIFPDLKMISRKFPGATYISYPTGLSAAAFTKSMQKIRKFGVFPPEALDAHVRKDVLLNLESSGIVINETFSRE